jgi:hypothetical protein
MESDISASRGYRKSRVCAPELAKQSRISLLCVMRRSLSMEIQRIGGECEAKSSGDGWGLTMKAAFCRLARAF